MNEQVYNPTLHGKVEDLVIKAWSPKTAEVVQVSISQILSQTK